jgi:hypothetical protein
MLTDVSDTVAGTLASFPIGRVVNNVRTADAKDPRALDQLAQ